MWTALTTKLTADAINIATAVTLVYLVIILVILARTGEIFFEHTVYALLSFVALMFADLLAIVHKLMTLGFPFRSWSEPGSGILEYDAEHED